MELLETMAGFLIQTTGTLKLEDDLKTTNWLRRRPAMNYKKLWKLNLINSSPETRLSRFKENLLQLYQLHYNIVLLSLDLCPP